MHKLLFISDHAILNDLYQTNFRIYLNCELQVFSDLAQAITALDSQDYRGVITLSKIGDQDSAVQVKEKLIAMKSDVPLFVVGEKSKITTNDNVFIMEGDLNVANILSTSAKALGVTAQEMAVIDVGDYYAFPIKTIKILDETPADLYIRITGENEKPVYSLCSRRNSTIDHSFDNYLEQGVIELYVLSKDRILMAGAITEFLKKQLIESEGLSIDDKKASIEGAFSHLANELSSSKEISEELIALSHDCIKTIQGISSNSRDVHKLLDSLLANQSGHVFVHTIFNSFLAAHIIKNISWGVDDHINKINFILFFHDLFLEPVFVKYPHIKTEEDLIFDDDVSDHDKNIVLNHASDIAAAIKNFPRCPIGAESILLQHHGTSNGIGFTVDYKDEISPLAKVIIIAEAYCEHYLISIKGNSGEVKHQAILDILNARFKKHTYRKIIASLENLSFD